MLRISVTHLKSFQCVHCPTVSSSKTLSRNVSQQNISANRKNEWRVIFEEQAKKSDIPLQDLYLLKWSNLDKDVQSLLKTEFNGSLFNAVSTVFPETKWLAWRFVHHVPRNYWKDPANQRKFFDDLGQKLDIKTMDDWYSKLNAAAIAEHGGGRILSYHKTFTAALLSAYPEHNWLPWKFSTVHSDVWKSKETQRQFFDWLGKELGIKELDDWYRNASLRTIDENGGRGIIEKHQGSAAVALMSIYPEHSWMPWKFSIKPPEFWKSIENQRNYMEWLGKEIGIKKPEDWYQKLTSWCLRSHGGGGLLEKHKGSIIHILRTTYPQNTWEEDKLEALKPKEPHRNYTPEETRKLFEDQQLSDEEWYHTSPDQLDPEAAHIIKKEYRGNLSRAVATIFPEKQWLPWRFKAHSVPKDFWKTQSNQRKFLDDLGTKLGIKNLDEWYQRASAKVVREHGGATVMLLHNGSPAEFVMNNYPEHNWVPFKFNVTPAGYWNSIENQRKYFDWLGTQLGVMELDDWYEKMSQRAMLDNGGGTLLTRYNGSPVAALYAVYPDHKWIPWKFNAAIQLWKQKTNVQQFITELAEKLSIRTLDDWYRVDLKLLRQFRANALLNRYRGLYNLLKEQYPHHPWDAKRFNAKASKKAQRWLVVTLKKIFPNEEIVEDFMHPKAVFPDSNRPMQLDVYLPSKNLAFEYQGIQHYQDVGVFSPTRTYQQRDEEKRSLCTKNNIKLVEVPYWWNRTEHQLQEMIKPVL